MASDTYDPNPTYGPDEWEQFINEIAANALDVGTADAETIADQIVTDTTKSGHEQTLTASAMPYRTSTVTPTEVFNYAPNKYDRHDTTGYRTTAVYIIASELDRAFSEAAEAIIHASEAEFGDGGDSGDDEEEEKSLQELFE